MVNVYFESRTHAELVAVFADEAMYDACAQALEAEANKLGLILTESVTENNLEELWNTK